MTLAELRQLLPSVDSLTFRTPDGEVIPPHYHVTEVGRISKHYVDCGGIERKESVINFQLWVADDYDHRLLPTKLMKILEVSDGVLGDIDNLEIEVEYQRDTIGRFGLSFDGKEFQLIAKKTACLAEDKCGITSLRIMDNNCCTQGSGCC